MLELKCNEVSFQLRVYMVNCMLNNCLEWDKWVLNERTYLTPVQTVV